MKQITFLLLVAFSFFTPSVSYAQIEVKTEKSISKEKKPATRKEKILLIIGCAFLCGALLISSKVLAIIFLSVAAAFLVAVLIASLSR